MAADATKWVSQCARCQVAQGNYVTARPKIGHLKSNNPMDLLCLDFTKIDPSRTGKENVLVITDAFSKFSVAVITPNQKALTVAKVPGTSGFMCVEFQPVYTVIKGSALIMTSLKHCVKCMELTNHSHVHIIHGECSV